MFTLDGTRQITLEDNARVLIEPLNKKAVVFVDCANETVKIVKDHTALHEIDFTLWCEYQRDWLGEGMSAADLDACERFTGKAMYYCGIDAPLHINNVTEAWLQGQESGEPVVIQTGRIIDCFIQIDE